MAAQPQSGCGRSHWGLLHQQRAARPSPGQARVAAAGAKGGDSVDARTHTHLHTDSTSRPSR
eukprot:627250-Pyramimonas_sp.AAC.1